MSVHACSGMGASAIGLSHVAVQFPVYEYFKTYLAERRQKQQGEAVVADRLSTVDLIVASSVSKVNGPGLGPLLQPTGTSVLLRAAQSAPLPAYQLALCAGCATVNIPECPFLSTQ